MLRFSGVTLEQNIRNISELLPDTWWMDTRPCIASSHKGFENFPSSEENGNLYQTNESKFREYITSRQLLDYFSSGTGSGLATLRLQSKKSISDDE
jgi:hypothetical protein